jgi:hypothetical protein
MCVGNDISLGKPILPLILKVWPVYQKAGRSNTVVHSAEKTAFKR